MAAPMINRSQWVWVYVHNEDNTCMIWELDGIDCIYLKAKNLRKQKKTHKSLITMQNVQISGKYSATQVTYRATKDNG